MDKKILRTAFVLIFMCFVSLYMVTRTQGFENIRAVQFLLIFVGGAVLGLALGLLRTARRNASSPDTKVS